MVAGDACYLDASALVKLVVTEAETRALRGLIGTYQRRVSSRLAGVELARAISRRGIRAERSVARLLRDVDLVDIGEDILLEAARVGPPSLRTLDAIHLATALAVRDDLAAVVSYDRRLAEAALAAGLPVVSPT
ncbi:MAG: type II toxin-antitoxin system VapC family toxin [Chloroflexota bacterium]